MDLSKIMTISGKSGLFQVVSQLKNAVLVESLIDKKRFPAFSHDRISTLEEISIFTYKEDILLKDVLKNIFEKEQGKPAPDAKSDDKTLKAYFLEILPDYDQDRVYVSDIRKVLSWYNQLLEHNLLDFTEEKEAKEESTKEPEEPREQEEKKEPEETKKDEKPRKKKEKPE